MQNIECLETEVRNARVYCEFTDEKIGKFQFVKEFLTSNNRIYMIVSHWD